MIFLFDHTSINPLSPTAFTIFGIEIGWYGIFIMTGALIALIVGLRAAKRLGIDENLIIDGFLWGLIIGVVGARLWYVFSEWDLYKDDPITIITGMRSGGLAIHGAVVFAGTFAVLFCLKKKINLWVIVEFLATGFLIGQIFGRWGNFFNQEAHGGLVPGATLDAQRAWLLNLPLPTFIVNQMYIDTESMVAPVIGYYHPTFFYEFLWNVIGLSIIIILRKVWKKYWIGDAVSFYFMWYSVGRFLIESLRTDSLWWFNGTIRAAQATSVLLFIGGLVLFIIRRKLKIYPVSLIEEWNKK